MAGCVLPEYYDKSQSILESGVIRVVRPMIVIPNTDNILFLNTFGSYWFCPQ